MSVVDRIQFNEDVYSVVQLIPQGQVTTYGHIARLIGFPNHSRMVGSALRMLRDPGVPWHRVVNHRGGISVRDPRDSIERQATLLRNEGVEVSEPDVMLGSDFGAGDGGVVSLARYGWFPASLEDE